MMIISTPLSYMLSCLVPSFSPPFHNSCPMFGVKMNMHTQDIKNYQCVRTVQVYILVFNTDIIYKKVLTRESSSCKKEAQLKRRKSSLIVFKLENRWEGVVFVTMGVGTRD